MSSPLTSLLSRFRPQQGDVPAKALIGWYARKGLGSGIRGLFWKLRVRGDAFPFFVGKRVTVAYARQLRVGKACVIGANSTINAFGPPGIEFGDRVTLREGAWIQCASHPSSPGEGLRIDAGTYIGPGAVIGVGGRIHIGVGCQFGAGVTLIAENHAMDDEGRPSSHEVIRRGIVIGDHCWLGHRVTVLDGVSLGEGCVVGAGAVVTRSFPAGSRVAGVPARLLGPSTGPK
ncbi:acyltransferase [Microbacterium aurantiacum]